MKVFGLHCLLFFIALRSFSQAGDTISLAPGDRFINSSSLKNYTAKFDFYRVQDGSETLIGNMEERFIVTNKKNWKEGLRICRIRLGSNSILDSGLTRLPGLAPIYHRSIQTQRIMSFDFAGNLVTGKVTNTADKNSQPVQYTAPAVVFDSYYEDIIAKTITFKHGLLFKFPEYIYERGGLVWSLGEVRLDSAATSGKTNAWHVRFSELNDRNEVIRTTNYRIDEKTREIISREYITTGGRLIMRRRAR